MRPTGAAGSHETMTIEPCEPSPADKADAPPSPPSMAAIQRGEEPQQLVQAYVKDPLEQLKANPNYLTTGQGIATATETVGTVVLMVLYLLMGHSITYQWYAHAAFLLSFTYCLNNTLIIISGMASPHTQHHLPLTFFYSIYHCSAGLLFMLGGAVFYHVNKDDNLRFRNLMGTAMTGLGLVHIGHGLSTFMK